MGFELSENAQNSLSKISYVPKRIQWDENIDEKTINYILNSKFENWDHEREIRLFFALNDPPEEGKYFVNFNEIGRLSEILIGARSAIEKKALQEAVGEMSTSVEFFKVSSHLEDFKLVKSLI